MNAEATPNSQPSSIPPDGTTPNPLELKADRDKLIAAIDQADMRRVLDQQTAINNGLKDDERASLAAAVESGRYLLVLAYVDKAKAPNDMQWRLSYQDFPAEGLLDAREMVGRLVEDARRQQPPQATQSRLVNHAIPNVGE